MEQKFTETYGEVVDLLWKVIVKQNFIFDVCFYLELSLDGAMAIFFVILCFFID